MRTVIMVYIIIAILGFTAGVILLCRAMYKSISKRHTENTPGIVIFPVFLVLASIAWPLCLIALCVLTIIDFLTYIYPPKLFFCFIELLFCFYEYITICTPSVNAFF